MSDQFLVGDIRSIQIANPAAGAEFTYTVPAGLRLKVLGLAFLFTSDANVANRQIQILVTDPIGGLSISACTQAVQAAGQLYNYYFAPGNRDMAAAVSDIITVPLSETMILKPGDVLDSFTVNGQAGDTFTDIYLLVEAFILP